MPQWCISKNDYIIGKEQVPNIWTTFLTVRIGFHSLYGGHFYHLDQVYDYLYMNDKKHKKKCFPSNSSTSLEKNGYMKSLEKLRLSCRNVAREHINNRLKKIIVCLLLGILIYQFYHKFLNTNFKCRNSTILWVVDRID